jgi:hypothetical protein
MATREEAAEHNDRCGCYTASFSGELYRCVKCGFVWDDLSVPDPSQFTITRIDDMPPYRWELVARVNDESLSYEFKTLEAALEEIRELGAGFPLAAVGRAIG